jgi:phosphohistidine swiveling domain-containing protein
MMKVFYLNDSNLTETDLKMMGGKASNLNRLSSAGFPVPPGFVIFKNTNDLNKEITEIGGFPVAVRSSGSLEDMANASFAGLYDTFLNIQNSEELSEAIKNCFLSKTSPRVLDYLKTKKLEDKIHELSMSVLVQKMVDAKIAGVLFTLNPINGREEEMYLELCEGVGERLVSGHVTPTQITFDWFKHTKGQETINNEGTVISDSHLSDLINLASRIQAYYGTPQDIEWAIGKDDKVYILQSRPITTFSARVDRPELTNADFKDGGVSARVCTPFMFSVYREALKNSMGDYFKKIHLIPNDEMIQWIHYHYGRVYWNAEAVKEGLKKIPGFNEEAFDRDIGIQKKYPATGPHITPFNLNFIVGAIPVLLGLHREFRDCQNMITLFRDSFNRQDNILKQKIPLLKTMIKKDFDHWLLEVILFQNITETNYFRTIYNNSNFQSEYKTFLRKLPAYQAGDEIDLMSELSGVAHLDVQGGLFILNECATSKGMNSESYIKTRKEFLKLHYHHGPAELDLLTPRWGENVEWVDNLVKSFSPIVHRSNGQYHATYSRLENNLGFIAKNKFVKWTATSREFLRLREEMRSYSTRAYYLLRLGLLEFARRNGMEELDAFMLDVSEIKKKIILPKYNLPETQQRRKYYEGYRNFTPPNEFGGSIEEFKVNQQNGLQGLGCSPGEFIGRARVIFDIHATGSLTKEEILITSFTDPGWTPVLARVGGVVTEVGGLLSHAAVIGREYGIPAILNLINATKLIQDGDLIKINGKTGIVEILEKSS